MITEYLTDDEFMDAIDRVFDSAEAGEFPLERLCDKLNERFAQLGVDIELSVIGKVSVH